MATIKIDGDQLEKDYWDKFIKDKLPSYEPFWLKRVHILRTPGTVYYKSDAELVMDGKSAYDVDIAQLSYSVLRNLIRAWEILQKLDANPAQLRDKYVDQIDLMIEGVTRLVGTDDNVLELLEKLYKPNYYSPFDRIASKDAKEERLRQRGQGDIDQIRYYRNYLVHNPLPPQIIEMNGRSCLPKLGTQDKYRDWRAVTNRDTRIATNMTSLAVQQDFDPANRIFQSAWDITLNQVENEFRQII